VSDDLEDFDAGSLSPGSEFDRDGEYALASPGLSSEERTRIAGEARSLATGLSREALGNWICREVARTVGARSGFCGVDANGNEIDRPEVIAARRQIKSAAGSKRQSKRNAVLRQWQQRYWELVDAGQPAEDVQSDCWIANKLLHRRANNQTTHVLPDFEDLPPIYGRDGRTLPRDKKRFLARFKKRPAH
jgi:hypothetical protein